MPYRVCIFVSERRSIAGYVTERTDEKTHARGCKATNQNFRILKSEFLEPPLYIGISPLFDGKIIYSISKKEEKHAFLFVQR